MSRYSFLFIGVFLLLLSTLSFVNIIYSYYFNLYLNVNNYLPTLFLSLFLGLCFFLAKKSFELDIFKKIFIVLIGYVTIPILIAIPFYLSLYNITIVDSYFEAISGFTSTGFTLFENIKHLDQSLILWRSTSQWIGGLYFLFSIILLIDIFDENLKKSLTNFLSFDSSEFLKQSFKVFIIYIIITLIIFLILKFINFRNFDALNFALTIISSGGFKSINQIDYLLNSDFKIIIFSITLLFSFFSIFLLYNLIFFKNRYSNYFTEDLYLFIYLSCVIFVLFIFSKNNFPETLFAISSSVSNIGFFFSEIESNKYFIYLILVIIGGSFFSTSSGLRFYKIYTLIKFSINELLSHSKPKQIMVSKNIFDKNKIDYNVVNKYFLAIIVFIFSLFLISSLLSISGLSFSNSIKIGILTLMNTVNSSLFGIEYFNFESLSQLTKIYLIIFMIIGRVEFITIIILFKKYLSKN